ncbi:interleukin-18-binding protein [Vombatus ursinus]|uniref:Interleukin-18-binding protein-like domain-containing protein n=1 Tax=Vombatus ursinus TaxID=29139 RepID=A0A4X2M6M6_VOMUR|nr:interleukin-18-binding protein [Vombatus ursinus]
MNSRKPGTGGPDIQSGSLIFLMLLMLTLGLALAQDAVLLCPEKALDVMVKRTESEMSMTGTLILSCKGCSQFAHSSFLYWLGNRSFTEHLPGKLWEDKTRRQQQSGVTWLQRDLVLEELSPTLQSTNFSCVLVDPAQVIQHHVLLAQLGESDTSSQTPNLSHQPRSPSPVTPLTTSRPGEESQTATPVTSDQP